MENTPSEWLPPQAPTPAVSTNEAFGAKRKRAGGGVLAVLAAAAAKGKALLLLLPKIKLLSTAGTALVSIAAYALFWGWTFAVVLVGLLLIHEYGHVIAARREGIPASAPMFIPFFGAFIAMRQMPEDAAAEARVGLAGPIAGSLGAGVAFAIAEATNSDFWRAVAYVGFFLNLFNLIPVSPLDGGRAMAAMAPAMWFAGLVLVAVLAVVASSPFLVIILLVSAYSVYTRWQTLRRGGAAIASYYAVAPRTRALVAVVYLTLIAALALGMHATYAVRHIS